MSLYLKNKKLHSYQETSIKRLVNFYKENPTGRGYLHIATGGGKTMVANHFILENFLMKGKKVLWLAWDWELLSQAHNNLKNDFNGHDVKSVYISDSKSKQNQKLREQMPEYDEAIDANIEFSIMYSSMQTFKNFDELEGNTPDIVIIDEAHHGKNGETEKGVFEFFDAFNIPVLGLSGTPKKRKGWSIIDSVNFRDLVKQGFLAKPIFESVSTNISIDASRSKAKDAFNFIQQEVYGKLSRSKTRNDQIVNYYDKRKHGKTIVFAIDIDHAEKLANAFSIEGIRAYAIHSDRDDSKESIDYFKKNNFDVAVTVNMLNQGIDIPDVKTLFVTKPVTSDILYSQMIGRGARVHSETGKESFLVVDFEDNFLDEELKRMIFEPKVEYFGASAASRSIYNIGSKSPYKRREKPEIIYPMSLQIYKTKNWENYSYSDSMSSFNLPLLSEQTFGVELELTTENIDEYLEEESKWHSVALKIFEVMKASLPADICGEICPFGDKYHTKDYKKFNLVYDGSCGWEIVSPVLMGVRGFSILDNFLKRLNTGLENVQPKIFVNYATGLHVHFGFSLENLDLARFLRNLWTIETHVACLLPPSRMNGFNGENEYDPEEVNDYCSPLCHKFDIDDFSKVKNKKKLKDIMMDEDGEIDRYLSINFKNLLERDGINTIEVRSHSGTTDPKKILSWISLWMGLFDQAVKVEFEEVVNCSEDVNPSREDFAEFRVTFNKLLPKHHEMIKASLIPRTEEILQLWKQHIYAKKSA